MISASIGSQPLNCTSRATGNRSASRVRRNLRIMHAAAILSEAVKAVWKVRKLHLQSDTASIEDICRNVYGGQDYLPHMLPELSRRLECLMLVAVDANDGTVDGVIAAERRKELVFLFALRVRESRKGQGLAHLLMREICAAASTLPAATNGGMQSVPPSATGSVHVAAKPPRALVSATIAINVASQRVLSRQGLLPTALVDIWPTTPYVQAHMQSVKDRGGRAARSLIDSVPGVRLALEGDDEAQRLQSHWRQAGSSEELTVALQAMMAASSAVPLVPPELLRPAAGTARTVDSHSGGIDGTGGSEGTAASGTRETFDTSGSTAGGTGGISSRIADGTCRDVSAGRVGEICNGIGDTSGTGAAAHPRAGGTGNGNGHTVGSSDSRCFDAAAPLPQHIPGVLAWLPGYFDVVPASSDSVREQVQAGHAWILPAKPTSASPCDGNGSHSGNAHDHKGDHHAHQHACDSSTATALQEAALLSGVARQAAARQAAAAPLAVAVLGYSHESQRHVAGVVATSATAVHAALQLLSRQDFDCSVALLRLGRWDLPEAMRHGADKGLTSFIVYARSLENA